MNPREHITTYFNLPARAAVLAIACLFVAVQAHAVTITYSSIQEKMDTETTVRAGSDGVRPDITDTKSDSGSSTGYGNILDSFGFDQYMDLETETVRSATASAGSELIVELLPVSDATNQYAMTVNGVTGAVAEIFQGGRADARSRTDISFLFEVDQTVRFSTYLFTEYGGGGYSTIYLYAPDGSVVISLDNRPPFPLPLPEESQSYSVGLSGLLQPGGQYRFEAHARSGNTVIGNASGSANSAANLFFQLETLPVPPTLVPAPAAAWLFGGALGVLGILKRQRKAA